MSKPAPFSTAMANASFSGASASISSLSGLGFSPPPVQPQYHPQQQFAAAPQQGLQQPAFDPFSAAPAPARPMGAQPQQQQLLQAFNPFAGGGMAAPLQMQQQPPPQQKKPGGDAFDSLGW